MQLKKIRVTNYRSVEDSGEFTLEQVLCLVGKNEAGKTAILQALAGLNPHPATPIAYNKEKDYPRRHLTDYNERHEEEATVIKTEWLLTDTELNDVTSALGPDSLSSNIVKISRRYGEASPSWDLPINFKKVVDHLLGDSKFNAAEKAPLQAAGTTDDLRKALENIAERTEKQNQLLEKLKKMPGNNATGLVKGILEKCLPRFMYFSHYDRMEGQIRLDTFKAREAKQAQPSVTTGEQVFVDFLEYAGTSLEEINSADTYEGLNARCEAASNKITAQLLEYWTQNPNLEIEVRVTKAEPGDEAPFNSGIIARARVKNNLHKVTVPFSERSAGFIWFFSFLVKFSQVQKDGGSLVLLLDEPGLTLHGKAQADLLRYFDEQLAPDHQIIFSTHSPFMVPADKLMSVRIVEDRILSPRPGIWTSEGTKVREDALATDRDTLFPLQGALGYEITQTLFVGKHTLLVEGPGDILFLQSLSSALGKRKRTVLDPRWTLCPAGGIDKIQPFVSLFSGAKLNIAALTDYAKTDQRKFDNLKKNKILEDDRLLSFAVLLDQEEADIEDIFSPNFYTSIVNKAFGLPKERILTLDAVQKAEENTVRILKKVEAAFRILPPEDPEFDHFTPASWLFAHPEELDGKGQDISESLDRAEKVIMSVNKLLPNS